MNCKKILFIISTLSSGGAARVVSTLANHLSEKNAFTVEILTHTSEVNYYLNNKIIINSLFSTSEIKKNFANKIYRRIIYWPRFFLAIYKSNPDTAISFLRGMNWRAIVLCKIIRIKVIATEHINHLAERCLTSLVERNVIYRFSNDLVVLTEFDKKYYSTYLKNVHLIPNPLSFSVGNNRIKKKIILAVGDMNRWHMKGFDTIIDIFHRISSEFPDWRLKIIGPGKEGRAYLQNIANKIGIQEKIIFCDFKKDIHTEMEESEIFALSSRYEGFSMVLLEAMSKGCACISFDCHAGPSELLRDQRGGILIEHRDIEEFARKLKYLIACKKKRMELGCRAMEIAKEYDINIIEKLWLKIM